MVKITVHERCDNAPKKAFLRDFVIAAVNGDAAQIDEKITDDVRWNVLGRCSWEGRQQVLAQLQDFGGSSLSELVINTVVTHGYDGAVDGLLTFTDGGSRSFCHIFTFRSSTNNSPIKAIRTYEVAIT